MKRLAITTAIILALVSNASAHGRHRYHSFAGALGDGFAHMIDSARPRAWCGWYMRQVFGVADASYNLARNWASYGHSVMGPHIGAIVVWRHHVGLITGGSPGAWIVKSGNDGGRVRERQLSVAGAIEFREP